MQTTSSIQTAAIVVALVVTAYRQRTEPRRVIDLPNGSDRRPS